MSEVSDCCEVPTVIERTRARGRLKVCGFCYQPCGTTKQREGGLLDGYEDLYPSSDEMGTDVG